MENKKALASLKKDGFVEGDDTDFASIRDAIDNNAVFFSEVGSSDEIAGGMAPQDSAIEVSGETSNSM